MTIDASIPLSVRPPQLDNPVDMYGKAVSLKSLMLQSQGQELAMQDAQRLRGIYSQGATDPASLRDLLYKGGFPDKALAMDKDVLANQKAKLEADKANLDKIGAQHSLISQTIGSLGENPTPELIGQALTSLQAKGVQLDPNNPPPQSPDQVGPWMQRVMKQGQTVEQQLSQKNQEWERAWKMSQPQSEYGKAQFDANRPGYEFSPQGVKLNANQGNVDPNAQSNSKIALWKAAGNHVPEGQIPFVDADGTVKTKTDPNWLAAKNEIAKNSATVVNNNIGGKSFNEKFGSLQAGQIEAEQKKAQGASDTILTMHKVRDAIDNGVFIGGKLADTKLAVTQVLQGLHVPLPKNWDGLAVNSSEFNSFVGAQLLQHAKDLGTNPSNADAGRIDKILGKLGTDPKALVQVMDFNEEMARKAIDRFNGHLSEAQANAKSAGDGTYGFDMSIPQPGKWSSSKPAQNPNVQPTPQRPGAVAPNARPVPVQVNAPTPVNPSEVDPVSGAQVRPANLQPQKTIKWEDLN